MGDKMAESRARSYYHPSRVFINVFIFNRGKSTMVRRDGNNVSGVIKFLCQGMPQG
jgi:hypothetical protein